MLSLSVPAVCVMCFGVLLWLVREGRQQSQWSWTFLMAVGLLLVTPITLGTAVTHSRSLPNLSSEYRQGLSSGLAPAEVSWWFRRFS